MNINTSFTAASTIPAKLITNASLINKIKNHTIYPTHIQLNPTNKCPLNCSFCSCKDREHGVELKLDDAKLILDKFAALGTEAVTITGGGDPLAYTYINELIEHAANIGLCVGLVTNGILFRNLKRETLYDIKWCRISVSDEQKLSMLKLDNIITARIDWSFSYVLTDHFDIQNLIDIIVYANAHNFTHVRIVDNILGNELSIVETVKHAVSAVNIDDSKVIYQGRKQYEKGSKQCFMSLLKPNIDANGNIFPCCGIQYAIDKPSLTFDSKFVMGNTSSIEKIWHDQLYFDGSVCKRCFYSAYNSVLEILWNADKLIHREFI